MSIDTTGASLDEKNKKLLEEEKTVELDKGEKVTPTQAMNKISQAISDVHLLI